MTSCCRWEGQHGPSFHYSFTVFRSTPFLGSSVDLPLGGFRSEPSSFHLDLRLSWRRSRVKGEQEEEESVREHDHGFAARRFAAAYVPQEWDASRNVYDGIVLLQRV